MKKLMLVLIVMIVSVGFVFAGDNCKEKKMSEEAMAVKTVIKEAYVKGMYVDRDVEAIKKGFHPDFKMQVLKEDGLSEFPLSKWVEKIKKWKEKEPEVKTEYKHKLAMLDVKGNAAVARLDVFKDGEYAFTDYMSLYKFKDGWKIVNKIYHYNPELHKEKKKKSA